MNCFVPYTDLNYMLHRLPSPRGDELFRGERMTIEERKQLPSPHGDELFHGKCDAYIEGYRLPSPRGDELFLLFGNIGVSSAGYRPLAGMNCFSKY